MVPGAASLGFCRREARRQRRNFLARRRYHALSDADRSRQGRRVYLRRVDRMKADPAFRERYLADLRRRQRARRENPAYRARLRVYNRRADVRARQNASRKTDAYRAKNRADVRARYQRTGGKGYRRHLPALLLKQGFHCALCGGIIAEEGRRQRAEVDHVVPVSKGGGNNIENLQAVHQHCNASKGNRAGLPSNTSSGG